MGALPQLFDFLIMYFTFREGATTDPYEMPDINFTVLPHNFLKLLITALNK
jgi:hypothetical protein